MNQIRYSSIPFVFLLLLVCNLEANTPLFEKYANSSINDASLVERQGLKYQVNTTKPFSGRFLGFEDEFGFCVSRAGSYRNGLLHGAYEEYDEGYLYMEGQMVYGLAEGEWIGYEYGRVVWTEDVKNDITMSLTEFLYYDNGQISEKNSYNGSEELHGFSEAYHSNGQLESKTLYENGELVRIIEKYDFNGNSLIR